MPQRPPPAPKPPPLLPAAMLEQLAARGPILLCLDYDGTISELVSRPAMARPVAGVVAAIESMAPHGDRIAIALVSGRPVAELRRMTGLGHRVMYAGVHGLEIAGRARDGGGDDIRVAADAARRAPELDRVRAWLTHHVPAGAGFEVEDKRLSVALHYRNAEPAAAAALCAQFEDFVRTDAPHLRAAHNKMVVEALPAAASKGIALRALGREAGAAFVPVYFGDDRTDEDAFAELASRGVGVLVGEARPSLAHWRVDSPAAVARVLTALAASLG
ncbi:MAG TPA: trehalose-phosphatase [Candidatus Binataceae bacterium]|nr:trehalose-phosphatase [Candidatus Binataceae bacterium]